MQRHFEAPLLETERLRLRGFRISDLEPQAAMNADEEVVRYVGGQRHDREDTWRRMLAGVGLWQFFGFGSWVVERKGDGLFLGHVGFQDFKRDMVPSIEGLPEIGWFFARHAHGQGFATEAVTAALHWADTHVRREIVALIDEGNAPSRRLAEKTGFGLGCRTSYRDNEVLLYRRSLPAPTTSSATAAT